jgi:ABC-type glycerol-3-phosphate transport system permease component
MQTSLQLKPERVQARSRGVGRGILSRVLIYLVLAVWLVISLFPFYWTAISSLTPVSKIFTYPPSLLPHDITTANFSSLLTYVPTAWRNLLNSFILAACTPLVAVFFNSLAGFAFAKFAFKGKRVLFALIIGTMLIPMVVSLVPLFIVMVKLHLVDTLWSVFLPGIVSAYGIFLFRQAMFAVPDELLDAGRIDGAGNFVLYYRVALPIVMPMVITLYILGFLASWNDYLWPLITLSSSDKQTLPVALAAMQGQLFETPWGSIMAGAVILMVPTVIIFATLSRYIAPNILSGALKQ